MMTTYHITISRLGMLAPLSLWRDRCASMGIGRCYIRPMLADLADGVEPGPQMTEDRGVVDEIVRHMGWMVDEPYTEQVPF
jgi:hypothetical protein